MDTTRQTNYATDFSSKRGRKPPTLIVIDMQPDFRASENFAVFSAVGNLMQKAVSQKRPIVMVEFHGYAPTWAPLSNLVKNYNYCRWVTKYSDDGSGEILQACRVERFPTQSLIVCGVNADYCVYSTVEGLSQKLPQSRIKLVRHACRCECDMGFCKYKSEGFAQFASLPNVVLTGRKMVAA